MKEIVIPPARKLSLRIIDRLAEVTLLAGITAGTLLALRFHVGG